ncbi:MAG: hypothetical protein PUK18_05640 [Firmicutes bacterium]|nr:hypothetical protein [Bacillota bacterium]MDY6161047.1 hypothetical protein [Candidatus Faecousia sp.]
MACHDYDDILHLSRPVSGRHARMSMVDRGAQFSPFAALVGYEQVLQESARLTQEETFLDESSKELLDRKLRFLADHLGQVGQVRFLCYRPDERKSGGSFLRLEGSVKKIDLYRRRVVLADGQEFAIEDIRSIDGVECENQ